MKNKLIKNKKRTLVITMTALVIVIGVFYLMNHTGHTTPEMGSKSEMTEEEIKSEMKHKADKSILVFAMEKDILFKESSSKAKMNIENMPQNNYDIKVEIRIIEDNKLIYESKEIKPGYIIREDILDSKLEEGRYNCMATIIAYEGGEEKLRSNAAVVVKIEE